MYDHLNRPEDIDKLHAQLGLDREMLLVLYTQHTVRNATRTYYRVKGIAPRLLWEWQRGTSLAALADRINFPPILAGLLLMLENKVPRKQFWHWVADPRTCPTRRLQREIQEICEKDMIYSPKGMDVQRERGKRGEQRLHEWLDKRNIKYTAEPELRGKYAKTPDALLSRPLLVDEDYIWWIESKASFGDDIEFRRNYKRQLAPYTEMFGRGMVVYWFGYLDIIVPPDDVVLVSNTFFEDGHT